MSYKYQIGIFGGDTRQAYMAALFSAKGYPTAVCRTPVEVVPGSFASLPSLEELFQSCRILIGPIPFTRDQVTIYTSSIAGSAAPSPLLPEDMTVEHAAGLLTEGHLLFGGVLPPSIIKACETKGIFFHDLMKDERIAILNAIATAEGTIMEAIAGSDRNLHGSKCLVLGYGRCARVLAAKLKAMDAHVLAAARSAEAVAYAEAAGLSSLFLPYIKCVLPSCDFIFNTIPAPVLTPDCLDYVDKHACIIDIASAPGGVDFTYAAKLGLNARLCLGLPGKVAPRTSSDILVTAIDSVIKQQAEKTKSVLDV
ncbi:dipicolinate synthase subunit A [Anaerotaenia torta]|uniref:dipicolinate synthase subunit DpsA n=1 Tax=Anaerotaenia torta TaxID=433293 RepID=UPI003D1D49F9